MRFSVLAELDERWQMVQARRSGNSTRNMVLGLARSIRYLTDRLDADPVTPEGVAECRRPVTRVDQLIAAAKDPPELRHPDFEILGVWCTARGGGCGCPRSDGQGLDPVYVRYVAVEWAA